MTRIVAAVALLVFALSAVMLEREAAGLTVERLDVAGAPVTLWRPDGVEAPPLAVVAHGYAGSRQMMRAFAVTLARSGIAVANVDLPGHGRHPEPMTGDITRLDGATARLVDEVVAVAEELRARPELGAGLALLGHSMATDVVVRAAERLDPDAVVAVSMYSEAVTATAPDRLLILSGAREGRLREVALAAVRQLDAAAGEGQTVTSGEVMRRAVAAPGVGHVGVLYAPSGLVEARDWIAGALGVAPAGRPPATWVWLGLLLTAAVALAWPLAAAAGPVRHVPSLPWRRTLPALFAPVLPAVAAAVLMPDLLGLRAVAPVAAFLAVWGGVQGAMLLRMRPGLGGLRPGPALVLIAWAVGVFALALDRYGAAFLPTGMRLAPMLLLLPAALLFVWADALLTRGAGWPLRIAARLLPSAALLGVMFLDPVLGVAFTVIPVTLLFWLVFGLAARWMAARTGPGTAVPMLGLMLAWAIAASTPMIAG